MEVYRGSTWIMKIILWNSKGILKGFFKEFYRDSIMNYTGILDGFYNEFYRDSTRILKVFEREF